MENEDKKLQNTNHAVSSAITETASGGGGDSEFHELGALSGQTIEDRNGQHHPIAEFLYQLTKMLTDDNNEIIEWADGRIKVHHPERLEGEVLHKYFRHSKFASFQRQLNYFGFRKIAGKGKLSPCSYVNEAASSDLRSLLLIKRKTNGTAARKAALQQRAASLVTSSGVNPLLAAGLNFATLAGDQQNAIAMLNGQALSNAMALLSQNALRASVGQIPMQSQQLASHHQLANPQFSSQQLANQQLASQQLASQQLTNQQLNLLTLQQSHQLLQKQLQDQQQQQQLQMNLQNTSQQEQFNKLSAMSNIQQDDSQNQNFANSGTPSLEQLHAHLAALSQQNQQQQQQNNINQNLLRSAMPAAFLSSGNNSNLTTNNGTLSFNVPSSSLHPASAALNRATAAINAQQPVSGSNGPATAAMDAASATAQTNNNLFESAANLKSLLNEHQQQQQQQQQQNDQSAQNAMSAQQALFNRFPSSNGLFPENMSTVSFGNLLGSSNRLNSLLSLNSFLGSREPSLADFAAAMPASVRDQLAAGAAVGAAGGGQGQKRNQSQV